MSLLKTSLKVTAIVSTLFISTQLFAKQFYVIGQDSNNCKVQWEVEKPYITGTECRCMRISPLHDSVEWVTNFKTVTCEPVLNPIVKSKRPLGQKPALCDRGDGCDQLQCLQLLYEDNSDEPMDQIIVTDQQCVKFNSKKDIYHRLPHCRASGYCPNL